MLLACGVSPDDPAASADASVRHDGRSGRRHALSAFKQVSTPRRTADP